MTDTGKVLVTGATGNIGSGLVPALRSAGVEVRAFVRDESKAQPLKDVGAEIVVGDLDEPETIEPALAGVDSIYLLTWNGPNQARHALNVVEAAKRVGTPHLVRHSAWGTEKSRIIRQTEQVEEAVKSSGLPWTVVKPTFYMQNTMLATQTIATDGVIHWDMGDGRLSMIDARDIVDVAATVLTSSGHEGKSYVLTGPEAISFHDVAAIFSKVLEKEVSYVSVPGEAVRDAMVGMGFPEWVAEGFVELSEGFRDGFANRTTDHVESLTGHPARSFENFARDYAQLFGR